MTENGHTDGSVRRPYRFQYSLRTLLVVTILAAVGCSVFFRSPVWVAGVATGCVVVLTPILLGLVPGERRGYLRAFCAGAMFPALLICLGMFLYHGGVVFAVGYLSFHEDSTLRALILRSLGVYVALVVLGGGLGVFVHWVSKALQRRDVRRSRATGNPSGTGCVRSRGKEPPGEGR